MNSITQNNEKENKNIKRYLPHDLKTKEKCSKNIFKQWRYRIYM